MIYPFWNDIRTGHIELSTSAVAGTRGQGESSKGTATMNQMVRQSNRVSEMHDDQLLTDVAQGDHRALHELFDRHSPWLAARLRASLPPAAVEEVLQETFISVWRGASRYQGRGEVGAWMWGIARKQAALWLRKRGRSEAGLDPRETEDPAVTASRTVDLEGALMTVGPEGSAERELVRLVFIEDRSIADVAAQLGIPSGTVKSRVFKVRQRLQAALRQGGY
jgi:RNA polymerase sigma-70 factor, ECF subfamily